MDSEHCLRYNYCRIRDEMRIALEVWNASFKIGGVFCHAPVVVGFATHQVQLWVTSIGTILYTSGAYGVSIEEQF